VDSQLLKTSISTVLREYGFKGKGSNFYLPCDDVVLVVSLRKSTHGNYYYLDCGVELRVLSGDIAPKRAGDCRIQFNFNALAGESVSIMVKALDMESAQDNDVANLISLMREQCLPQFIAISSLVAIRDMYKRGALGSALLLKKAREVLESD
jgi:Domain of unknown function (DUF4304)